MSDEINLEPAEGTVIPDADLHETVNRMLSFEPAEDTPEKKPDTAKPPADKKPEGDTKPPEKKEPASAADEEEYRGKKASDWKLLKGERDKYRTESEAIRKELDGIKSELQKARSSGASQQELETLKKERDDLDSRLQRVALENHPKFQAYFKGNMDKLTATAKQVVGAEQGARLEKILSLPDDEYRAGQLEELYGQLSNSQQARLASLLTRMDELRAEREHELGNWKENYSRLQEAERAEQENRLRSAHQLFDGELSEAKAHLEVFMPKDGDQEWNAEVTQRVALAKQLFSGESDPKELARAAIWAAACPVYRAMLDAQKKEIAKLQTQLKELTDASPRLPSGEGKTTNGAPTSWVERVLSEE